MLDSLVRVSRRVEWTLFVSIREHYPQSTPVHTTYVVTRRLPPYADFHRGELMLTHSLNCFSLLPSDPFPSLSAISSPFHTPFEVLFIFPSQYLFAIGLLLIFSFRRNLPPTLSCTLKQLDSEALDTAELRLRAYHPL